MRKIYISDNTIRRTGDYTEAQMSFRLKIEIAKHLDNLGLSSIETATVKDKRTDYLLVKSIASAVKSSTVTVPVDLLDAGSVSLSWDALKDAAHSRLQVPAPASTVQMEYFCHKKADALVALVKERIAECRTFCDDVEFVALDFTRSEGEILNNMILAAVEAGAGTVTVSDQAGNLLPDEFFAAVRRIREILPKEVRLGVQCSNVLYLAEASAIAAVRAGADEIKTSVFGKHSASVSRFSRILNAKSEYLDAFCDIRMTALEQATSSIKEMCDAYMTNPRAVPGVIGEEDTAADSVEEEQVPETYRLESYLINSGNIISSTCHLRLRKGDSLLESVCVGNGPVDASFQAVEKLVGAKYELDDFKIRSVTEGREAMGETVIHLRHEGRLFSGKGVSTDIVGSSILAYIDAANKIAYEEDKA